MAGAGLEVQSYREVILFLATAGVVVPLFHRLRISPVIGFLAAGAVIGPHGLGQFVSSAPWLAWFTIADAAEIRHLAEFGVVFLLFMIGVELSWARLNRMRRLVFGLGGLQVFLSSLVIGGLVYAISGDATAGALVGLALSLSSTAIVLPVLAESRRLTTPAGRSTFAVLLFQDLAVAPILFAVAVLSAKDNATIGLSFLLALAQAFAAILAIVVFGRLLLRPLFGLVAATRSPELFMAASLLVVVGTAVAAAASGLSMALGAFIAGLLLAETEYRRAIEATIDPFKGLLLGVFFVSVGMAIDIGRLADAPGLIFAAATALLLVKGAIVFALAPIFGLSRAVAAEAAAILAPGGEFAFVILGIAALSDLVPAPLVQTALMVTTVTMVAIPLIAKLARGLGGRLSRTADALEREPLPPPDPGSVIVCGNGRVGRLVGDMLKRHSIPYIALDMDPGRVSADRRAGLPVYFGDSTNPDMLRNCGIASARALVVTLDAPKAIEAVVEAARSQRPDITIIARARDARHAAALYDLGVTDAVPETIEASLQLSEAVLIDIGVPMGLVIASVHERRDEYRRDLQTKRPAPLKEFRSRRGSRT
jgi:CPA2 family monovalent cation:H+ antiporter-2